MSNLSSSGTLFQALTVQRKLKPPAEVRRMPKRSNEFQKLVYLVKRHLAGNATVTESHMLVDLQTGRKREVDVCLESVVGGHVVRVCLECRDQKRPADVSWIDAMKAKHERLPTHALILVSRSGFTPEARDVARRYGSIEVLAFEEINRVDVGALLGAPSSLWTKSVTASPLKVIVRTIETLDSPAASVLAVPDNLVYTADGSEAGPMIELVQSGLNAPAAQRQLLAQGQQEHISFTLRWQPRDAGGNPFCLKKTDPIMLQGIESIDVWGSCQFTIEEFRVRRGVLGTVEVAWGKTAILGTRLLLLLHATILGQIR